jgi:hypothetical protein|tara:strand:- start:20 stop:166 length:147 start_codon:yes stop_codon:yes gene_type:complete
MKQNNILKDNKKKSFKEWRRERQKAVQKKPHVDLFARRGFKQEYNKGK